MALMSPPILVAASTAIKFSFSQRQASVNAQVRFYTDAAGLVELAPLGTGSRAVTATNTATAFEGLFSSPGATLSNFDNDINGGTITAAVDGRWYEIALGSGMGNLTLVAAPNVTPGTAVTYRIIVDAAGSSQLA
jgi:hypothetical protein